MIVEEPTATTITSPDPGQPTTPGESTTTEPGNDSKKNDGDKNQKEDKDKDKDKKATQRQARAAVLGDPVDLGNGLRGAPLSGLETVGGVPRCSSDPCRTRRR